MTDKGPHPLEFSPVADPKPFGPDAAKMRDAVLRVPPGSPDPLVGVAHRMALSDRADRYAMFAPHTYAVGSFVLDPGA